MSVGSDTAGRHPDTVEHLIRARLATALGGWRGSVEAALPTVAFVVVWITRHDVREAVLASAVPVLLLLVARLVQRQTVQYVLSSLLATALAAFFALRSGRAQDAFLPGMLVSGAYLVGTLVSILARCPVVGFLVAVGDPGYREDPFGWRRNAPLVRVAARLTWVLVALFALRLLVMVPLYVTGQVAALGIAKIVLSWPAYVAAVAVMGLMLVRGATPVERAELEREADAQG
ncbi:DUF3159 domain-containing protein [Arsenicicoccus sp. oral taxon 190]|uniref:DUF3159 domain-containing protein n=1 Tax=Arsenicicoccus sp. oral taxon 190 TaxID=1658671 RepID=UPI000679F385|nr:DUF3159 domain-containing protein [Arsenicicoccus sp. oral taxon 190]AKT52008.1 membrane protein [Arsenicicoccus sp. oral taxon 190]